MLLQGENLQYVLPTDIYCHHLEDVKLMMPSWMIPDQCDKGLYADYLFNAVAGNWAHTRPRWVMLTVHSLTRMDIKSRGVPVLDLHCPGDRAAEETDWGGGKGGRAEPSNEWAELFTGHSLRSCFERMWKT
ncbi:TraB domain containing 2A [Rhinolophus ferrumequinum]|uniref:Metalloprotease TIKI n=1 Tax=Rhinolophus ferrumequinum TaxID=59479 RepID=A0A7J7V9H4_RHIFE|nr:TraB domain containing 2A [Rhinolophus ferrumequinum]